MRRFINTERIAAAQMTTPEDNPLVTDDSRMMDVWFRGEAVRKQMFRKVSRVEQERLVADLEARGFVRSKNLLIDPKEVLFAEMEHELVGGVVTIGYQDNGKPLELKVSALAFAGLCEAFGRS